MIRHRHRSYTVHVNPNLCEAEERCVLVVEGMQWGALVLGALWLLAQRLWAPAIAFAILQAALFTLAKHAGIAAPVVVLLNSGLQLWLACEAGDLRRAQLRRQGYDEVGVVLAASEEEAELRYASLRPRL